MAQGLASILLQSVQVIDCRRGSRAAGLEVMRVMAFHFFSSAAPGVGAGARAPGALLGRTFSMRVINEVLRKRNSFGRRCIRNGFGADRCRGTRGSVTLVNIVQEVLQTCDPCSGPRVALALFWWD